MSQRQLDRVLSGETTAGSNFCSVLSFAAQRYPERTALDDDFGTVTYAELWRQVCAAADVLAEYGVRPGECVASLAANCHELVVLYFATAYLGAISVPLNMMLKAGEIGDLLDRVSARLLIVSAKAAHEGEAATRGRNGITLVQLGELAGAYRARESEVEGALGGWADGQTAMILFTSGSTSRPKGCMKSHANLIAAAVNHYLAWPRTAEDRELYAIPLAGIGFANYVLPAMLVGATTVVEPFAAEHTLGVMERHKVTASFLPATMLDSLLRAEAGTRPHDLSAMRLCQTSYAMSQRLRQAIWDRFPGSVHYSYGLTEGGMSSARADQFLSDPTCVGVSNGLTRFGIAGEDGGFAAVGEVGEIIVAGPDVMMGYLDDEAATAQALQGGWLHTGDLGYLDAGGYLHFAGRQKDMIKTGGTNVAASEVEQALRTHVAVREAAVIGVPDDHWGEMIYAYVELEAGHGEGPDELTSYLRTRLAAYKVPKVLRILEELPRNPNGKLAKGELNELALS